MIRISNIPVTVVRELTPKGRKGINRIECDLLGTPPPRQPRNLDFSRRYISAWALRLNRIRYLSK
jgi:hypothetical protein